MLFDIDSLGAFLRFARCFLLFIKIFKSSVRIDRSVVAVAKGLAAEIVFFCLKETTLGGGIGPHKISSPVCYKK